MRSCRESLAGFYGGQDPSSRVGREKGRGSNVNLRRRYLLALAAAAASSVMIAPAAKADGAIHSCVDPLGTMRIVPVGTPCKATETALDWNAVGPAGPPGLTGPIGPP